MQLFSVHYDNDPGMEYSMNIFVGVFTSKELAEKAINLLIRESNKHGEWTKAFYNHKYIQSKMPDDEKTKYPIPEPKTLMKYGICKSSYTIATTKINNINLDNVKDH